jgi:two-component system, LytTR family, sensor kinase
MLLKKKLNRINYKRIAYHVLFWVVISVFYDAVSSWLNNSSFIRTLVHDLLFFFPTDILGVYFTIYFLIPRFLLKKKYMSFTIYFFIFFIFLMIAATMPLQYLGMVSVRTGTSREIPDFIDYAEHSFLIAMTIKLMIIGIAASIKLAKVWYQTQKRQQSLLNEKLEINLQLKKAELKYLKSQINPHFLFNALNNLYSLTLEKSEKAPEVVLKISSLLNYVLYECDVPRIELNKEVDNIRSYIDLQKIRYDDKVNIVLDIQGEPSEITIAPLLILPVIENAFKHGLDKNVGNGFIKININVSDDSRFNLTVTNSLNGENNHEGEGIGLSNLKKRLELQYPQKHKFSISVSEYQFITNLCIDLI